LTLNSIGIGRGGRSDPEASYTTTEGG
jgi:hypothetical protein